MSKRFVLLVVLLAPAIAEAQGEPWFVDVAQERGLPTGLSHRNVFCDLDGDGWPDAVLHNQRVFRNVADPKGGRRFVEVPQAAGLLAGKRRPDLLLFADLDDDGDRDAFVGYAGDPTNPKWKDSGDRSRVFLQDRGRFLPVLLPKPKTPTYLNGVIDTLIAGAFLDVDHDGRLDLVTSAHYKHGGKPLEAYPLRLLRGGVKPGRFQEITAKAGLSLRKEPGHTDSRRPIYGISVSDVDGNGFTDILVCAYGRQRNMLYLNRGDGTFRDVGIASGFAGDRDQTGKYPAWIKQYFKRKYGVERKDEQPFRANGNTFDAACADVDNDGDIDVFLGEITHAWAGPSSDRSSLLVNQQRRGGPLRFLRRPDAAPRTHRTPRWNQGDLYTGFVDVDNDGLLDLVIASCDYPDRQLLRIFRQGPQGTFTNVTTRAGIKWDNCTQMSFADYDRDGDVDILIGNSNFRLPRARRKGRVLKVALFENRIGNKNHWLNVRLRGKGAARGGANRDGIGARITVHVGGWQATREISGGRGHAGHNDAFEAAFGLGRRTRIDKLVVRWPNKQRTEQVFRNVPVDRFLIVEEGRATFRVLGPH